MKMPGYTQTSYPDVQVTACNWLYTTGDFIKPLQDQGRCISPNVKSEDVIQGDIQIKSSQWSNYLISLLSNA
jgi:hypothetical protein